MDAPPPFFDWALFLPARDPWQLTIHGVSGTADFSAMFIWIIVLLYTLASLWLAWRVFAATRNLAFYHRLLRGQQAEKLPAQRRDLRQRALPRGAAWLGFDASWVATSDGQHLYQTQPAEDFFNPQTLAPGLTGNRLIAAMPGILTAFGILGTFAGLQIGLSRLDLDSPQELTASIVPLIQGAAVAFATSVWGTAASMLFNVQEKSIEQWITRRIRRLQHRINALVPRHLPEQTLVNIEHANQEAENALKGLAEQIGARMQEAMLDVPDKIQAGIEASIAPAVDKLVRATEALAEKQSSSSHDALAALIREFTTAVAQSGEHSKASLDTATADLSHAIAQWSEGMEGFLGKLDHRAGAFDQQVGTMLDQGQVLRDEGQLSREALSKVATELRAGGTLLNEAATSLKTFTADIAQAARILGEAQLQSVRLSEQVSEQQQAANERLEHIGASLAKADQGLQTASQSLQDSAKVSKKSTDAITASLADFQTKMETSLKQLRKQTSELMTDYATDVQEQTRNRLDLWNTHTQEFAQNMVAAVNAMNEILAEIDQLLNQRRDS